MSPLWPVQVEPLAPLACGSVAWRRGDAAGATIIVKATFALVHEGTARLVTPIDLECQDGFRRTGSIETASELAPYLPSAGIVLSGAAHAPPGQPTRGLSVRLGVFGERPLVNKVLHVIGDRTNESPASAVPFETMPIVYERAFGGARVEDNPVGTGAVPGSAFPNVVDPQNPIRPAGFGPIAKHWGQRRRLLVGAAEPSLADIPGNFDWSFFHAAPPDQQVEHLRGNEWIVLDGLHPTIPHFRTRLPDVRAHAHWHFEGQAGPGRPLDLRADTLVITPETQVCCVIWRGLVMVEAHDAARMQVTAGVEMTGYAAPAAASPPRSTPSTAPPPPYAQKRSAALDNTLTEVGAAAPALPFAPRAVAVDERPTRPPPALQSDDSEDGPMTRTLAPNMFDPKTDAPFAIASPGRRSDGVAAPIPGAPWAATPEPAKAPVAPPPVQPVAPPPMQPVAPPSVKPVAPPSFEPVPVTATIVDDEPAEKAEESAPAPPALEGLRATIVLRIAARESLLDLELAGADLHELNLSGAVLSRMNLAGANLIGSNLSNARLGGATLTDANLTGADLSGADLSSATLKAATLKGARLDNAILTDATLSGADGTGASFASASAARAIFAHGTWDEAGFAKVDGTGADFRHASLAGARFEAATLADARFDDARGSGATFAEARLARASAVSASFPKALFTDVDGVGSSWESATLDGASFARANLKEANLSRATSIGTSFANADLTSANLQRFIGDRADLSDAKLTGADLRQAKLQDASFERANLRDISGVKADLSRARCKGANLGGATLRGAKLTGASFVHADLEGADFRDAEVEGMNVFGASRKTAKLGSGVKGLVEVDPDAVES